MDPSAPDAHSEGDFRTHITVPGDVVRSMYRFLIATRSTCQMHSMASRAFGQSSNRRAYSFRVVYSDEKSPNSLVKLMTALTERKRI